MSQLQRDLNSDWGRLKKSMDKGEIIQGLGILSGILAEIAFMITLALAAVKVATVLTGGLAALGLPALSTAIQFHTARYAQQIGEKYESLNRDERKAVRAALAFLGISPQTFL